MRALCGLLCLCIAFNAAAATYYVSPAGSDAPTADGSENNPFLTITKAVSRVLPGDTISVAQGTYKGFDVDGINGQQGSPITIVAPGRDAQIVVTTDREDNRDTILINSSSYVVIDGLRSFNANRAALRISEGHHITVRNCVFGDNMRWGIFTGFSDDLLIEKNECYGSEIEHGIYVSNTCTRPIVRGNRIHDNHANGLHMNGDRFQGGAGIITNALVEGNIIYNNGEGGGSGINCDGVQNSVFRNNLIYAAKGAGITLYKIDASAPSINAVVINNTIDVSSSGKWALQIHTGSSGAIVFNNIFLTNHSFRGSIHLTEPADQNGLFCDYNVLTTNTRVATTDDDNTYYTLAQWQALGYDQHSVQSTHASAFLNSANADYHLLGTSPALDAGVALFNEKIPPASDLEGRPRPSGGGFDIGAYETVAPNGNNSAPAIVSGPNAVSNPATIGKVVIFSVAANDLDNDVLTYTWDFGDGIAGTGSTPIHAYSATGDFTGTVTVSDGLLTATASVVVTVAGPLVGSGPDSDADGFSDSFETAAGTDPQDDTKTPLNGTHATPGIIQPLNVSKLALKLNFAKPNGDDIAFSGALSVASAVVLLGQRAPIDVGGISKGFVLLANGSAKKANDSIKISVRSSRGTLSGKYAVALKRGAFVAELADEGLANADLRAVSRQVVCTLIFGQTIYQSSVPLIYSAKAGKFGKAIND